MTKKAYWISMFCMCCVLSFLMGYNLTLRSVEQKIDTIAFGLGIACIDLETNKVVYEEFDFVDSSSEDEDHSHAEYISADESE